MAAFSGRALAPYLILFAALYAGFGAQSPYLPALLGEHGLMPEAIGKRLGYFFLYHTCLNAWAAMRPKLGGVTSNSSPMGS